MRPETESQNSGDHELGNHEMRGSPVCSTLKGQVVYLQEISVQIMASHLHPLWQLVKTIGFTPIGQVKVAIDEFILNFLEKFLVTV